MAESNMAIKPNSRRFVPNDATGFSVFTVNTSHFKDHGKLGFLKGLLKCILPLKMKVLKIIGFGVEAGCTGNTNPAILTMFVAIPDGDGQNQNERETKKIVKAKEIWIAKGRERDQPQQHDPGVFEVRKAKPH